MLLRTELISIFEKLDELLLGEFNIGARTLVLELLLFLLLLQHNLVAILIDLVHLFVLFLLHLLLMHEKLLLLFGAELLQEFLLLLRVETLKCLHKLQLLLQLGLLLGSLGRTLLET